MFGCQQVLIKSDKETQAILEYLCRESNHLYNCAVYYARQMWFKTGKFVSGFDLTAEMKTNPHFNAGYASSMQQTCINVGEAFKSFKQLLTRFRKGELEQKPKPPKYRKSGGLFTITYPKRWLKLNEEMIRFPLGNQVKAWFGIGEFFLPMPSNLDWETVREIRILPKNGAFYAEFVYPMQVESSQLDSSKALGLDPGLNNWLTCVSNVGTNFIVDGKELKALNQWYNKQVSTLKDGKPQGFWSRTLAQITEKRNRQMRDAVNKAARIVVNHCLENGIGLIVFGWNKGQKDSANMGAKTNQKFVCVPTAKLKNRIAQLCELYGIEFIETEESYTSKASFLDNDELPKYGEKPNDWKPSGKRVMRGLFRTATFGYINADSNGAANILRKIADAGRAPCNDASRPHQANVKGKFNLDLSGLTRGVLTAPIRLRLW